MSESQFAAIDEQKFHRFHVRALLVTGLGVFCDGYDISAIGLVLPQALAAYGIHKIGDLGGVLSAAALVGSIVGALIFGALAQKGRKRFYGLDALILGVAALAQAFMPTFWALVACRFVLGIGVGGDYVLSPTIMAEHANRADRGKAIGLGFGTMWPIGALAAAVLKLLLDSFHVPPDLVWKIVLAGGAVPALGVMYFRRRMPESARFLAKLAADKAQALAVMQEVGAAQTAAAPDADSRPFGQVFAQHARHIFAAALLWMMYDLAVYSSILFGPNLIAANLHIPASIFTIENELIFIIPASVLGSWLMIDQWGRKPLQVWGFVGGAVVLAIFAILRSEFANLALLAFLVFGLFNIALTGPGLVSGAGIFGVELAPTRIRSVAQSITVVGGRIGAAMSGYLFPAVQERIGFVNAMWGLAALSLLGGVLSQLLVPETSSRSLEEINLEQAPLAKAAA